MKKALLIVLAIVLTLIGISDSPMLLIFPMWIITYLLKGFFIKITNKVRPELLFFASALTAGLLTESLAIWQNSALPPEQRILISPDPLLDLFYGLFWYAFISATWVMLLRKYKYSAWDIFFLCGAYGILTEESGGVFLSMLFEPITGQLYALYVMFVYAIFILIGYMFTKENWRHQDTPVWKKYPLAILLIFIQYAIYGNLLLPFLKSIT